MRSRIAPSGFHLLTRMLLTSTPYGGLVFNGELLVCTGSPIKHVRPGIEATVGSLDESAVDAAVASLRVVH